MPQCRKVSMWQLFGMDRDNGDFFLSQEPLQEVWRLWRLFLEALSISSRDLTWSNQCTCSKGVATCWSSEMWTRPQDLCLLEATRFQGETDMWANYFSPVWWAFWWCGIHTCPVLWCWRLKGKVHMHLVWNNKIQKSKCGMCTLECDDFFRDGLLKNFISFGG